MIIQLSNTHGTVTQATEPELQWISERLSWKDTAAFFRRRHGYQGDGVFRLFDRADNTYPAGWTGTLAKEGKAHGLTIEVQDVRQRPPLAPSPNLAWLRDYQMDAVAACLKRTRGVVWAVTSAGKTEIAAGLVRSVVAPWLFVVHTTQLVRQAADRYKLRTGLDAGIIGEGKWTAVPGPGLTCATFQSLYAGMKSGDPKVAMLMSQIQGVIADECHSVPAATFYRVLMNLPNAFYRIGISGTPMVQGEKKSMGLIGAIGQVIFRVSATELLARGLVSRPKIRMVRCHQVVVGKTETDPWGVLPTEPKALPWAQVEGRAIVKSKERNQLVIAIAKKATKPCLVFVRQIKHGRALEKAIRKAGLHVEFVNGSDMTESRMGAIKRLERGDLDVIVANVVFQEGVDIPELRSVIIAAGGASAVAALQRVGRGMRKVEGKTDFEVWDFFDTGNKLTERHTRLRAAAYRTEEYEVVEVADDLVTESDIK